MARLYPRFIYSDPQDTKSSGPFVVHTLFPQLIAKVTFNQEGFHQVSTLSVFTTADDHQVNEVICSMHSWLTAKRMEESKLSPDFYERTSDISRLVSGYDFFDVVSSSVTFKPIMGAKLEVSKNDWTVEIAFANEDTYHSTVWKLQQEYRRKYGQQPDWPLLGRS